MKRTSGDSWALKLRRFKAHDARVSVSLRDDELKNSYLTPEAVLKHYGGNQAKADKAMKIAETEGRT